MNLMANSAARAPSMALAPLQTWTAWRGALSLDSLEQWLEAERDQLPVWLPVALGTGIALWFAVPTPRGWGVAILLALSVALGGLAMGAGRRAGRVLLIGGVLVAGGIALAWVRAERVAAPVLARPVLASFDARVDDVEPLPARGLIRLRVAPLASGGLPPAIRLNVREGDAPRGLSRGARVRLKAWLMPPPAAALPGAYDFARVAWFQGIGATGRAIAPVTLLSPGQADWHGVREGLSRHIQVRVGGAAGAIAATLATGDRGAIDTDTDAAMRQAGLAHLLSISGLHVTAVVGAAVLVVLRLLALIPVLALRVRLPVVAAGAGALAAIGYTLLTGAEVPTIRSCIAAILVLAAMAMGREAMTLRLIAAGAFAVLTLWPEALVGPSFQLSFAAVTTIVALHGHPRIRALFAAHEEPRWRRIVRGGASLLLTGLVVEAALAPIALFHFHKAGLYGAVANIVAIPLTTFVVMPAEALALALDSVGLGAPAWWVVRAALDLLLGVAHAVASAPGSVAGLPTMADGAFVLMVAGGLWLALWRTRWRGLGLLPLAAGALWAAMTPNPDLLVTGDGRHVAVASGDGYALLRERAGDYTRATLSETAGFQGALMPFEAVPGARCSPDSCIVRIERGGRRWTVLATRSGQILPWDALIRACDAADIVVSERRLPRACRPRWLLLDPPHLAHSGGISLTLSDQRIRAARPDSAHPWIDPPTIAPPRKPPARKGTGAGSVAKPTHPGAIPISSAATARPASPAPAPVRGDSVAGHRSDWPDQAGSSPLRGGNI